MKEGEILRKRFQVPVQNLWVPFLFCNFLTQTVTIAIGDSHVGLNLNLSADFHYYSDERKWTFFLKFDIGYVSDLCFS